MRTHEKSSGNVFADLGLTEPEELLAKYHLTATDIVQAALAF